MTINTNSISEEVFPFLFVTRSQAFYYQPFLAYFLGDPYRIRTDVNGVRGRCLNHLTNGPWCSFRDSNPGPTD